MSATLIVASRDRRRDLRVALAALSEALPTEVEEVLLVTPHEENARLLAEFEGTCRARHVVDDQKGKPAALNLALAEATGDIVVITDGDVRVEHDAMRELLRAFDDPRVGAAAGHPVARRLRPGKYAAWGRALLDEAHDIRADFAARQGPVECSGYLYAFRRALMTRFPIDVLSEDAYLSGLVLQQGYVVAYAPQARVHVLPPANASDWRAQKRRAIVGSQQRYLHTLPRMRSFWQEVRGTLSVLRRARHPREFWWLLQLVAARLQVWIEATIEVRRGPIRYERYWRPIGSTKLHRPEVGDVYCVANADLMGIGGDGCRECVVVSALAGDIVRVAPRGDWLVSADVLLPSPAMRDVFDDDASILLHSQVLLEDVLLDHKGRCPEEQLTALLRLCR
jgi:CTP:molybdopterin cytidylyltransferase MocA